MNSVGMAGAVEEALAVRLLLAVTAAWHHQRGILVDCWVLPHAEAAVEAQPNGKLAVLVVSQMEQALRQQPQPTVVAVEVLVERTRSISMARQVAPAGPEW